MEEFYSRRVGYYSMGMRRFSDAHLENNSVTGDYPIRRKMSGNDADVMKR